MNFGKSSVILAVFAAVFGIAVGKEELTQGNLIAALKELSQNNQNSPAAKVALTNKDSDSDDSDEIQVLSKQLADWCQRSGRCSLEGGVLQMKNVDEAEVENKQPAAKRGVGAVNDLCKLYRVKCKRSYTPFASALEEDDVESDGDDSAEIDKRSASSIGDMCKLYGIRCRRDDGEENAMSKPKSEEDKIYWESVRNFLKLCHRFKECDFSKYVATVASRVHTILTREIDSQLDDCVKSGLCREKAPRELMVDGDKKAKKPRELMASIGDEGKSNDEPAIE